MTIPDVLNVVTAAILSVSAATGIIAFVAKYFGERIAEKWLEGVKAEHARKLAYFEHMLSEQGKRSQASLDHAVTVTRTQFDVEFSALREIWKFIARTSSAR